MSRTSGRMPMNVRDGNKSSSTLSSLKFSCRIWAAMGAVIIFGLIGLVVLMGSYFSKGGQTTAGHLFGWTKLVACKYECKPVSHSLAGLLRSEDVRSFYSHGQWADRDASRDTLLAITTCNQWHITELMIAHLIDNYEKKGRKRVFDIVVVDDVSEDRTPGNVRQTFPGVYVVTKDKPRGLTHSWNLAYQIFKGEGYSNLMVVNNDLIIPPGAIERLAASLEKDERIDMLGPLYHEAGLGLGAKTKNYPYQNVETTRADVISKELVAKLPDSVDEIQQLIEASVAMGSEEAVMDTPNGMLGSFLSISRRIISKEIQPHHLFCPSLINLGQEAEMRCRTGPLAIRFFTARDAFVFHHKGGTLGGLNMERNSLMTCHAQ